MTRAVGARGPLLGGTLPVVACCVRVRPVIRLHSVDESSRARRDGPIGGAGWRYRWNRPSRTQGQGYPQRWSPPVAVCRDCLAQRASVGPHLERLGGALPHPEPQVATERAGIPPTGRGPRLGCLAPSAATRWRRPAAGKPRRAVRVREDGSRPWRHRDARRQGTAPAPRPRVNGVQLRAPAPCGLLLPARRVRPSVHR